MAKDNIDFLPEAPDVTSWVMVKLAVADLVCFPVLETIVIDGIQRGLLHHITARPECQNGKIAQLRVKNLAVVF